MGNSGIYEVKPDFTVSFLDKYGFMVSNVGISWIFDRIKPKETRTDYGYIKTDGVVYYKIDFN